MSPEYNKKVHIGGAIVSTLYTALFISILLLVTANSGLMVVMGCCAILCAAETYKHIRAYNIIIRIEKEKV